ncbi:MAG: ATP synthase subunit C [Spirochaetes bacterium]|jgi:V/A-type H+-transporting ATPase subunit K|nr:ATP synthase subunit C [Spirochaetota bacterium]
MNSHQLRLKKRIIISMLFTAGAMIFLSLIIITPAFAADAAASGAESITNEHQAIVLKWDVISAAIAFGMGALGAGMAIAKVGAAAMGAMSEKPEVGSQALIFVAMAEGIAVFGFIAALMILGKF